jgi:hypothetical protein
MKGQLTQAHRLGAGRTIIVDGTKAVVREAGKADWETPLDGILERIGE